MRKKRCFLRCCAALCLALFWGAQVRFPAAAGQTLRVKAYVYDQPGLTFYDRDAENVDELIYAFALIQEGRVTGAHWQSIAAFSRYVQKHSHIRATLAIGGWGAEGFSQAAATAEGRALFVESALSLMERWGFTGLDIDWEYPGISMAGIAASKEDGKNYVLLLRALREGLDALTAQDGKTRTLSVALGAAGMLIPQLDCAAVAQLVDDVHLMTYDLQTPGVISHHTALYGGESSADGAARAFIRAGIPAKKIFLGVAFYAHRYTLADASCLPLGKAAQDAGYATLSYDALRERLTSADALFDESAKAAFALDGTYFYTYDNAASIACKGDYAQSQGLGGLMCWQYGSDSSGELLRAMRESLQ